MGCPERTGYAAPEVPQHVYIGIERQITRIGVHHRQHALDVQTGKLRYHLLCVCAEIVCTQRGTDLFRLKTPCRGVHLAVNRTGNDPVLRMLHADVQNIADYTCANHLTRLTDERIAGVRIRYAEQQTALLRNAGKFLGFRGAERKRLIAYNVDVVLEKALCDLVMRIVCRHDGDKINTVLTCGLLICHFTEICIYAAGVGQMIRLSGRAVPVHAAGEAAADQLGGIVQHSAPAVEFADVRTKPAADHTKFQLPRSAMQSLHPR